jgi:hypothetical protein
MYAPFLIVILVLLRTRATRTDPLTEPHVTTISIEDQANVAVPRGCVTCSSHRW